MKHAVLSISGGMDSTSLLLHLLREGYYVHCLSFDYGQKHRHELGCVQRNIEYLLKQGHPVQWDLVDLSSIMSKFHSALTNADIVVPNGHYADENMKQTVVPNRNAIFSSIIYGHALSISANLGVDVIICLGTHAGDHAIYPDCRPEFHEALDHAFKIGNWGSERISNYLPYIYGNKTTILQDAMVSCQALNVNFTRIFANTSTCYKPLLGGMACGKCGSCTERLEAFAEVNLKDPVQYR